MLERLVSLAQRAGEAAMVYYQTDVAVELKADHTPVTAADVAAQQVITDELRYWTPSVPIVAEEGPIAEQLGVDATFWLVDPLDGTKEFLSGNGEFTVNIALVERGEPVLGVVHAPALSLSYFGGRALGSWRRRGTQTAERIYSSPPVQGEQLVVVESRSHPSPELEAYLSRILPARRVRVGSSLKFCFVADGTAHVYPRFGPTMEWDVAAGDCVFRNSGSSNSRISPLRYGKPGFRNGPFVLGVEPSVASTAG